MSDPVNHPPHYTQHPSGIECIQITEHMSFCLGNAVKYIWRADLKNDAIEDLRKAVWNIEREIQRREKLAATPELLQCVEGLLAVIQNRGLNDETIRAVNAAEGLIARVRGDA